MEIIYFLGAQEAKWGIGHGILPGRREISRDC
jgi:hypothetical protein